MAITWTKLIPRWGGDTIEPPEAKKDVGYIAGDKPPAKWENWLRKGTYEALDETRDVIEDIDSQLAQKANKQQGNWIDATLLNGWINPSSTTGAKYFKDEFGIVHLSGDISAGTITVGTVIFKLPEGYRPRNTLPIPTINPNQNQAITTQLYTDGNFAIITPPSSAGLRFNTSFRAEI